MRRRIITALFAFACVMMVFFCNPLGVDAQQAAKKEDQSKERRPRLQYERFRRSREVDVKMAEKRAAIRNQLQALLNYTKDEKERPSILFRLAENHFEEAVSFFYQAQRLDEKLAEDPRNEQLRAQIQRQKQVLKIEENKWRNQAAQQYKEIIDNYPTFPDRDQVLFLLGYTLWDMERYTDALTNYRILITSYPHSKYLPDAYLAFGEYYFEESAKEHAKLQKALIAYKKVAEYRESEVYPYALYKQGWCYFNLHDWRQAKDMFRAVIFLAEMEEGTTGKKIEIRKEALKDFVLTYSHEGSAIKAPQVFNRLAPKESKKMLTNLAGLYFGDGQDKKAIILYNYLIKQEKCSPEVPFYQGRIVDCGSRVGDKRYTVQQVRRLVDLFKKTEKCLTKPSRQDEERIKEARELAELTLRKLASIWYKEAKETKQRETFQYAQELFGDYLELFPRSEDAYDMRFAYAELLYHRLGEYKQAAAQYSKVVAHDLEWLEKHKKFPPKQKQSDKVKRSSPGTYLCDAAYKAVLAHRELFKKERKLDRKKRVTSKPNSVKPLSIPKDKMRFIRTAEVYMRHCPGDEDLCNIKYDIAETYYDFKHYDKAIENYDEVVGKCPRDDLAEYAANLVMNTLDEVLGDFERLDKYARKYYRNQSLMGSKPELRKLLNKLIPEIAFKRIADLESRLNESKKGQPGWNALRIHAYVARAYVKFYKEFKTHPLADEALFNSGLKFEQAERLDLAKKARNRLIQEYPTSDLVPETIFELAENYERMTDYQSAAELYERYAKTYKNMRGVGKAVTYRKKKGEKNTPKMDLEKKSLGLRRTWNTEDAEAALMNAGIYREALHQYGRAIQDRMEFVELFPSSLEAPNVYFSLGLLYEKMKEYRKAADVFSRYSSLYMRSHPDRAIASHMKRALMLLKMGNKYRREAEKEMQTTIALYRKQKRGRKNMHEAAEAVAHAQFIMAESVYREYLTYRFKTISSEKVIKQQLQEKQKRLEKVKKVYEEIAKLKQPEWAIASLYKIGRILEDFANTLYKAPLPKGLTSQQKELYLQMLRQMGQPIEDNAVTFFKAAVDKGSELGFYSKYTQLALNKLQHYGVYPREDLGFRLSVVSDTASRGPMLLAMWDEVKKNPAMLDDPANFRVNRPANRTKKPSKNAGPKTGGAQEKGVPKSKEKIGSQPDEITPFSDDEEPQDEFE